MSITATEVGKIYALGTSFDLLGRTELIMEFTSPVSGTTFTLTLSGGRVSAPNVVYSGKAEQPDGSIITTTFAAGTYMQITTIATDFVEAGTYKVCGTYIDGTPKEFFASQASLTILEKC